MKRAILTYIGRDEAFVISIVSNLAFFGVSALLIGRGLNQKVKKLFMAGIFLLLALAVGRYVDYFDNYVATAIVFMAAAAFIWLMNSYWNKKYAQ